MVGLHHNELGLTLPLIGEAEHFVANRDTVDAGSHLGDDPCQVTALPGRERRGKSVVHAAATDHRLAGVYAGRLDGDEHLTGIWCGLGDVAYLEHVDVAVGIETDCLGHNSYDGRSAATIPPTRLCARPRAQPNRPEM